MKMLIVSIIIFLIALFSLSIYQVSHWERFSGTNNLHGRTEKRGHFAAVVFARQNSKGLRNKNIVQVNGVSLLERTLMALFNSNIFDSVWVSSDSDVILQKATQLGAYGHKRSQGASTDEATTLKAAQEFIFSQPGVSVLAIAQCTSPFQSIKYLTEGYYMMKYNSYDSVFSATKFSKLLWRKKRLAGYQKSDRYEPVNFSLDKRPRRQQMNEYMVENGMFYFTTRKLILDGFIQGGKIGVVSVPPQMSLEIDSKYDLKIARLLAKEFDNITISTK